jgi:hypothetical protein
VTAKTVPTFLGGLRELEDHGQRCLVREAASRSDCSMLYLDGLKSYRDNTVNAYVLDVDKTITMCATSKECLSDFLKLTSNHIHLNTSSAG